MTGTSPIRILIVDDELSQMQALCDTLRDHGYDTVGFTSGKAALVRLREESFELILTDLMMPEMNGVTLIQAAIETDPNLVGIMMTGEGTITTAVEAMKSGALDYILKPFKLSVILPVLSRALAVRRLRVENAELGRHLRERTEELETSNKELEAFSYSISHDLRAPLRHVSAFSNILAEDFGGRMPPEALYTLNEITACVNQMDQLINDLLRFSRLGRQQLSMVPIETAPFVKSIVDQLIEENPGRNIEVRFGNLPDCIGDPSLLRQVFINLFSNAFKFTRHKERAIIEFGCQKQEDQQIYFLRDNGAGFDMNYGEKLFGVFQRLHSASEFEGTGVGLSIVKRIIQRHGGRIWAEAKVDQGATFYFSLAR